jgi:hypothetical protein
MATGRVSRPGMLAWLWSLRLAALTIAVSIAVI